MTDTRVVLAIVRALTVCAVLALAGAIYLVDRERPDAAVAVIAGLAGAALGGLTGLLASTRSMPAPGDGAPAPVLVDRELQPTDSVQVGGLVFAPDPAAAPAYVPGRDLAADLLRSPTS